MTKYFLHGGYVTVCSEQNLKFYTEILNSIDKNNVSILIIPFARDVAVWGSKTEEVISRFDEVRGDKTVKIRLADKNQDEIEDEIGDNDIVFIWGGDTHPVQNVLGKIGSLKTLLEGKVVVGSSAGALIFSKYYYENDNDSYHIGLGIIESGMICHWKNQYIQKENIEKIIGRGRVLCIPEGHYIVKEV